MTVYPVDQAFALHAGAVFLHSDGRPADALEPCRTALAILERECGATHPDVARVLLTLGSLYEELAMHADAEAALRQADDVLEHYARERDPSLIRLRVQARSRRAGLSRATGALERAELSYLQAIELADRELGHHDDVLASVLDGLGLVYVEAGRLTDAERVWRRALGIAPDDVDAQRHLAALELRRGRFEVGIPHARRVLDHTAEAADMAVLAALLEGAGRTVEAEALFLQAVSRQPDQACWWDRLGGLAAALGDSSEAEHRFRQALLLKEREHGPDHPEVAATLQYLGVLLAGLGRVDEAVVLLYRAHDL
ncbi:MAG TPA: tetratricopeptide repeat protein, partial [Acidimicrobiales bacterium]|nr:tetratricopeptide repeat protein [Acidimicrobiales bacterium]